MRFERNLPSQSSKLFDYSRDLFQCRLLANLLAISSVGMTQPYMAGEAGKWIIGYQFTHKKMGDSFSAVWRQFCDNRRRKRDRAEAAMAA